MIVPIAIAAMLVGAALGFVMIRRMFLLRSWLFFILVLGALTVLVHSGQLAAAAPHLLGPEDNALLVALLVFLVPPPLAAGLLIGGLVALSLRRYDKSA